MKLNEGDIILIDSLYGLYSPLTDGIADNKINLYIESLMQVKDDDGKYVRWTDIRLMRRMLRDATHRASVDKSPHNPIRVERVTGITVMI